MSQSYTIRSGDSLGAIARQFNTSVERLAQANHMREWRLQRQGEP